MSVSKTSRDMIVAELKNQRAKGGFQKHTAGEWLDTPIATGPDGPVWAKGTDPNILNDLIMPKEGTLNETYLRMIDSEEDRKNVVRSMEILYGGKDE